MDPVRTASSPAGGSKPAQLIKPGTAVLAVVFLVLVLALVGLWSIPDTTNLFKTAPLQVLLGSAVFIALIALIVVVFARLGLYDRSAPLGLPEGSVRALLALILLIIFIIFANVIFGQLSGSKGTQVVAYSGLSEQQVTALPGRVETKTPMVGVTGQPAAFEGTYRLETPSEDAANLGQQVVTGLLTLVAAISAFYFGTGSVTAGAEAMRRNRRPGSPGPTGPGGLVILRPSQPVTLKAKSSGGYDDLVIELGGSLLDEAGVQATIADEANGKLVGGSSDAQFVYQPSATPTDPVTLRFASLADPRTTSELAVHVPPTEHPEPPAQSKQPAPVGSPPQADAPDPAKANAVAAAKPVIEPDEGGEHAPAPDEGEPPAPGALARLGAALDRAFARLKLGLGRLFSAASVVGPTP